MYKSLAKFSEESPRHADLGQINVPQVCSQSATATALCTSCGINKMMTLILLIPSNNY